MIHLFRRYEAWVNRQSKNHPLFSTTTSEMMRSIDKNDVPLTAPAYAKTCSFTKTFIKPSSRLQRTTLDTTMEKHRFMSALDPM